MTSAETIVGFINIISRNELVAAGKRPVLPLPLPDNVPSDLTGSIVLIDGKDGEDNEGGNLDRDDEETWFLLIT